MRPLPFTNLGITCVLFLSGCGRHEETNEPIHKDILFSGSNEPGTVTEADALALAKRAVATNDSNYPAWFGTNVTYHARRDGQGWSVLVEITAGTNASGEQLIEIGGHRLIRIDERGAVLNYFRGR
jgi:hypothetical protein